MKEAERPGPAPDDAGMTMVELSIAMLLTSVLAIALASVFSGVVSSVRNVNTTVQTTGDARIALDAMTRMLDVAVTPANGVPAVVSGTAVRVSFYASLDRGTVAGTSTPIPTLVTYAWTDQTNQPAIGPQYCLNETRTPGTVISPVPASGLPWTYTSGATSRCLLRTSAAPDFRYYADAVTSSALGRPLSDPSQVNSVEILLTAAPVSGTKGASTALERVALTNPTGGS